MGGASLGRITTDDIRSMSKSAGPTTKTCISVGPTSGMLAITEIASQDTRPQPTRMEHHTVDPNLTTDSTQSVANVGASRTTIETTTVPNPRESVPTTHPFTPHSSTSPVGTSALPVVLPTLMTSAGEGGTHLLATVANLLPQNLKLQMVQDWVEHFDESVAGLAGWNDHCT
jgi:hypothetical protein